MRAGEGKGGLEVSGVTHRQQRAGRFVSASGILGQKSFFLLEKHNFVSDSIPKVCPEFDFCKWHKLLASNCANGHKWLKWICEQNILSEREVAPRFAQFTLFTMFTLFTLFKLLYIALTVTCMALYIVREGWTAVGISWWVSEENAGWLDAWWMGDECPLDCYDY